MHQRETKGILSAYNGMNISRGCVHGCIYCDALTKLVYDTCGKHGMVCNNEVLFEYMRTFQEKKGAQMELF